MENNGNKVTMSLRNIFSGLFSAVKSRNEYRINKSELMAERITRGMEEIQRAQDRFALAMTQYTEQLKIHTSAIEGLSMASRELTDSAAEQNGIFTRLAKIAEQLPAEVDTIIPELEETKAEKTVFPSGCYRRRLLQNKDEQVLTFK